MFRTSFIVLNIV